MRGKLFDKKEIREPYQPLRLTSKNGSYVEYLPEDQQQEFIDYTLKGVVAITLTLLASVGALFGIAVLLETQGLDLNQEPEILVLIIFMSLLIVVPPWVVGSIHLDKNRKRTLQIIRDRTGTALTWRPGDIFFRFQECYQSTTKPREEKGIARKLHGEFSFEMGGLRGSLKTKDLEFFVIKSNSLGNEKKYEIGFKCNFDGVAWPVIIGVSTGIKWIAHKNSRDFASGLGVKLASLEVVDKYIFLEGALMSRKDEGLRELNIYSVDQTGDISRWIVQGTMVSMGLIALGLMYIVYWHDFSWQKSDILTFLFLIVFVGAMFFGAFRIKDHYQMGKWTLNDQGVLFEPTGIEDSIFLNWKEIDKIRWPKNIELIGPNSRKICMYATSVGQLNNGIVKSYIEEKLGKSFDLEMKPSSTKLKQWLDIGLAMVAIFCANIMIRIPEIATSDKLGLKTKIIFYTALTLPIIGTLHASVRRIKRYEQLNPPYRERLIRNQ